MLLWAGLGNPEPGMARNRHNIGFMALDVIAIRHGFTPWRRRFKGLTAEGSIGGEKILALKPLTYMNASGEAVQAAAAFYKLTPDAITAFHDELDLAPGKLRVKFGGGTAGHNGLRSLDRQLGTGDFSKDEVVWLIPFLDAIADAAPLLASGKAPDFMTKVALLTQPPPA
jgi:PTH1 family peptidyl-tRNA hydrolase